MRLASDPPMTITPPPDIRFVGVEKRFSAAARDVLAVDRTDLTIRGGEFLVLLGPSGCGKTTMLRMIAGLTRPSAGAVQIGTHDLWQDGRRNARATARARRGVSGSQSVSLVLDRAQHRAATAPARRCARQTPEQGARAVRAGRDRRLRARLAARALRRNAAARGDCPRALLRSVHSADGRAVRRA